MSPTWIQRSDICHSLGFHSLSSSHCRPHLAAGSVATLAKGFFLPLYQLSSVCFPSLPSITHAGWVRTLPHAMCFPSSSSSLCQCCWHLVAQEAEEYLSQSFFGICSCLRYCMMRTHQSQRHGCNAYLLEGWVLGFQNPKQGASTTGRKLLPQMSPQWLLSGLPGCQERSCTACCSQQTAMTRWYDSPNGFMQMV